MLNPDDWKVAIEDARTRHKAIVDLIYFTEQQAMGLLRLYITLAVAAASAAIAAWSKGSVVPPEVGVALATSSIILVLGSWYCFKAMETAEINMPGRDAEFWIWANHEDVPQYQILEKYLEELQEKHALNRGVNVSSARAFHNAKLTGVSVPIGALAAGLVALGIGV